MDAAMCVAAAAAAAAAAVSRVFQCVCGAAARSHRRRLPADDDGT